MVDLLKTLQARAAEWRAGESSLLELLQDIVLVVMAQQERLALLEAAAPADPDFPEDGDAS